MASVRGPCREEDRLIAADIPHENLVSVMTGCQDRFRWMHRKVVHQIQCAVAVSRRAGGNIALNGGRRNRATASVTALAGEF